MKRVLVGYDGSKPARRALQRGCRLLDSDGELFVINVIHELPAGVRPGHQTEPLQREEQGRLLNEATALVGGQGQQARTIAASGDPGRAIAEHAEAVNANLVVVGTRGLGLARRLVLGSVSDAVVRHAGCDVLLVR